MSSSQKDASYRLGQGSTGFLDVSRHACNGVHRGHTSVFHGVGRSMGVGTGGASGWERRLSLGAVSSHVEWRSKPAGQKYRAFQHPGCHDAGVLCLGVSLKLFVGVASCSGSNVPDGFMCPAYCENTRAPFGELRCKNGKWSQGFRCRQKRKVCLAPLNTVTIVSANGQNSWDIRGVVPDKQLGRS